MTQPSDIARQIADRLATIHRGQNRPLIAIAGPPAAGKSTIAAALVKELNHRGISTGLVAMDGFHLSNQILEIRGLRARKGAPETFDLTGFKSLLSRLKTEDEVFAPTFDRSLDSSIGSSHLISASTELVVVEGNYLLLDEPGWRDLAQHWTFTVQLHVPLEELERRLLQRWLDHGFEEGEALAKAHGNDIPNARRVVQNSLPADLIIEG